MLASKTGTPLVKSNLAMLLTGYWLKPKDILAKLKANALQQIPSAGKLSLQPWEKRAMPLAIVLNQSKTGSLPTINMQTAWLCCTS
jgi:hypothetical protein